MSKKEEKVITDVTVGENTEQQERKVDKAVAENVVYLGPDIPNVLSYSMVFYNGVLPDTVREKTGNLPILTSLFVPISEMVEKVKELNKVGSPTHMVYERAKAEIQKGELF